MIHSAPRYSGGRQGGIGLIDVLVGLVVLSFGVLGLAQLQAVVMKDSGGAKARSIAVQLARAKLDDLRSYTQLEATATTACTAAGVFCYNEIGNNTGGAESGGALVQPTGTVTVANTEYTRTWSSTDYYYCTQNAAPSTANGCSRPYGDFKDVAVTITWTELDGNASGTKATVVLHDTISSIDPLSGGRALLSNPGQSGPIVQYVPGSAPEVIAIDVGGGQHKETTNPTPTVTKHGTDTVNTVARYETIRYSSTDNTITREAFTTLNCTCTQAGTGTGYNLDYEPVSKPVGEPADQFQTFECEICCRDHHDDSTCNPGSDTGKNNCIDPYRPSGDYSGNDHNHYTKDGALANNVGDEYVESCRLKRVDGYLRVVQDWYLVDLNAIPETYFTNGATGPANVTAYGNYVKGIVSWYLNGAVPASKPSGGWSTSQTVAPNATTQLNARGIYIDYMDNATKSDWASKIAGDVTAFQELPFYDVNMTKLGQWSTGAISIATISNDQVKTEEANGPEQYERGEVLGVSPGTTDATVRVRLSNTGVINEFITSDPDDQTNLTSSIAVTVTGTTYVVEGSITGLSLSANVAVSGIGSGTNSVTGTANGDLNCSVTAAATYTFSCSVPEGWSGAITPQATGYTFTPGATNVGPVTANQTGLSFTASSSVTSTYVISGSLDVSGVTVYGLGSGGSADVSCTTTASSYSCTVPAGWSGSVIASLCGYSFTPGAYSASNVSSNLTNDFTSASSAAATYTISGTINAAPTVATVSLAGSGSGTATCTYDAVSGTYSCNVASCWTGSITPSASVAGILFTPTSRVYSAAVSSNLASQDFDTSYTISGTVSDGTGTPLSGVTFVAQGTGGNANGTCSYDGSTGAYACIVPGLWNGSVIPSKSGYSFGPSARSYTNVTSTQETENYSATSVVTSTYTITVAITGLKNSTATNASVVPVTGLTCGNAVVSGSGSNRTATISCTVQGGWYGTVTPSNLGSSTTSPASQSYSNVTGNQSVSFACSGAC